MNILFLDKVDMNNLTGSEVHKWQLIKNLSELNNISYVPVKNDFKNPSIYIHFFKVNGGAISQSISFNKQMSNQNIDIIYTRNHKAGILGIWLKRKFKTKLVYEVNGILEEELKMRNGSKNERKNKNRLKQDLHVAKAADAIIAVSQEIADHYIKKNIPKDKIFVIENGVDTSVFKPIENTHHKIRKKYNLSDDTEIILFVGLFFNWQGIDLLIKSFKEVQKNNDNARLFLIGDGIERTNLESLTNEMNLKEIVVFTGRVDHSQIPDYISASNVCVSLLHPSKSGALKMWEYLACGRAVVATRMPAYEFIEKEKCGQLVEYGNIKQTAEVIKYILTNPNEALKMGQNGREYVIETHTWKLTAEKTIQVFNKILDRG